MPVGYGSHLQLPSHGASSGNPSEPIAYSRFECQTLKGKRQGKTKTDFFRQEKRALTPFQRGLFDGLPETGLVAPEQENADTELGVATEESALSGAHQISRT